MKRDVAERLAAISVEGLTLADAQAVIGAFLTELVRCPVCDGSGTFTFPRGLELPTFNDSAGRAEDRYVPAGTEADCPGCGSHVQGRRVKGDPDHKAYLCRAGKSLEDCQRERGHNGHSACGWHVVIALPDET